MMLLSNSPRLCPSRLVGTMPCLGHKPALGLPLTRPDRVFLFCNDRGDDAPTGTRRGGADALGGQAVFSKGGEHAFVGTSKGWLLAVHLKTLTVTEGVRVAPVNAPAVKTLSLSKSGTVLLANCGDRTIRTFDVPVSPPDAPAAAGAERPPSMRLARDFKNAVSNVQWSAATLSADSDYLVGASGGSGEHLLYVWCVCRLGALLPCSCRQLRAAVSLLSLCKAHVCRPLPAAGAHDTFAHGA